MEQTIREIIAQADDERNFDLIRWVKDILDEFASAHNCPPDWQCGAAEKVDTTAYIWYNIIIKYRRWYYG